MGKYKVSISWIALRQGRSRYISETFSREEDIQNYVDKKVPALCKRILIIIHNNETQDLEWEMAKRVIKNRKKTF